MKRFIIFILILASLLKISADEKTTPTIREGQSVLLFGTPQLQEEQARYEMTSLRGKFAQIHFVLLENKKLNEFEALLSENPSASFVLRGRCFQFHDRYFILLTQAKINTKPAKKAPKMDSESPKEEATKVDSESTLEGTTTSVAAENKENRLE
ncbi:MAG: hypothetical protein AABZ60_02295 [Planctomycetota bacterium]